MLPAAIVLVTLAGAPVKLSTGAKMCEALNAADLKGVGLSPDSPRPPNSTEKTGAYCTYTQAFASAGGIELDVFDVDPADAKETMKVTVGDACQGVSQPGNYPGVDESLSCPSVAGDKGTKSSVLVVRHRRLMFVLTIPAGPKAKDQLFALAKLVLGRVEH
jgi:hypothetical protein